jgi:alkylresorcinol/alkylpyrone synthase
MTPIGVAVRRKTRTPVVHAAAPRARPRDAARITGLQVSDGPTSYTQEQVLERLGLCGNESAEGVFARCGVRTRNLDLSDGFLALTLQGRAARVEEELFARAVAAVDGLGADPRTVGTVISSSLFSQGCPTIAHRLVDHYGMDPSTDKYHVTGVGCASAVPLMRLATHALRAQPERPVLIVASESMSSILTRATPEDHKAKTIGAAIFGDGCAAALLSAGAGGEGPHILATKVHQVAGSGHAVRLDISEQDSYLHLARDLPEIGASELAPVADGFLAEHGLARESIAHWMVHPGGRRIVEGARDALGLSDEELATSWQSLADHGNVGTPSIFYVLDATCRERSPARGEHGLAVTIGPGVTVGLMLLRW